MKTFFQILLAVCMLVAGSAKMNKQFHHKSAIQRSLVSYHTKRIREQGSKRREKEKEESRKKDAQANEENDKMLVRREQERLQKEALKPDCPSSVVNSKICNECSGKCTKWCSKGTDNPFPSANNASRCGSSCDYQVVDCRECAMDIVNQHEQISSNCIKNQTADPIRRVVDCVSQNHTQNTSEINSSLKPAGCFFDSDTSTTFWNSEMTSTTSCSPTNVCLCNTVQQSSNVSTEPSCYKSWANTSCTHFNNEFLYSDTITKLDGYIKSSYSINKKLSPPGCTYVAEPAFKGLYPHEITAICVGCMTLLSILFLPFFQRGRGFSVAICCKYFPYYSLCFLQLQLIIWGIFYVPYAIVMGSACVRNYIPDKSKTGYENFLADAHCQSSSTPICVTLTGSYPIHTVSVENFEPNIYNICAVSVTQLYWIIAGSIFVGIIAWIAWCCVRNLKVCRDHCCKEKQRSEELEMSKF